MKKDGALGRDEEIKRLARTEFGYGLMVCLLILIALIFVPYLLGNAFMNAFIMGPDDVSIINQWISGFVGLSMIVIVCLFILLIIISLKSLYEWIWEKSFENALKEYNKKHGGKKK